MDPTPHAHRTVPGAPLSRPAEAEDIPEVAALWCEAFPSDRTVDDRIRMLETGGRYGGLETVRVVRGEGGHLDAACKLYRMESHITGVAMPMMGLAAVAVDPARRRRGLGARLCGEALRAAVRRGDLLSVLYPFRPDYYERLGWGLVGTLHEHRFATDALPAYEAETRRVRSLTDLEDVAAVEACYARVAARSHGPITRDRRIWAYRLTGEDLGVKPLDEDAVRAAVENPRRRILVYDDDGVAGYALLRFTTPADGSPTIQVRELVAETETAYRGLLGALHALRGDWPHARHFARPDERFDDRLRDPRPPGHAPVRSLYFPTARVVRGPMLRVLDVPSALRRRRWFDGRSDQESDAENRSGTLVIAVDDAELPGNAGPWAVRLDGGGARVAGRADGGADPVARLATDAATFARIFAGDLTPAQAARLGRAEVQGDVALLDDAFSTRERFWLLDEF